MGLISAMEELATVDEPRRFEVTNQASDTADVWVYDEIGRDPFTGEGIAAKDFVREIHDITAPKIVVHLHSPGGNVFEAIAMASALREKQADVTVKVEGVAASAASFLAMVGNRVLISQGAQLMMHEAQGITMGSEQDHLQTAEMLNKISNTIASYYAKRAGGSVADWRAKMRATTWYEAEDAVKAGLADAVTSEPAVKNIGRHQVGSDQERAQRIQDLAIELDALRGEDPASHVHPIATDQEPTAATSQERSGWQVTPLVARLQAELVEAGVG